PSPLFHFLHSAVRTSGLLHRGEKRELEVMVSTHRLARRHDPTGRAVVEEGKALAPGNPVTAGKRIMSNLFEPSDLKGLALPNRIVMAPMTRTRATEEGVPTDLMRDYYVQRAEAGLIITECSRISEAAHGILRAPGIYNDAQVAAWRRITDAVHAAGGRIAAMPVRCKALSTAAASLVCCLR